MYMFYTVCGRLLKATSISLPYICIFRRWNNKWSRAEGEQKHTDGRETSYFGVESTRTMEKCSVQEEDNKLFISA